MKKVYTTPSVFYEDFSLTTNIAAACAIQTNAAKFTCGYEYAPDLIIFTSGILQCQQSGYEIEDNGAWDGICYHNPSDNYQLFNS